MVQRTKPVGERKPHFIKSAYWNGWICILDGLYTGTGNTIIDAWNDLIETNNFSKLNKL